MKSTFSLIHMQHQVTNHDWLIKPPKKEKSQSLKFELNQEIIYPQTNKEDSNQETMSTRFTQHRINSKAANFKLIISVNWVYQHISLYIQISQQEKHMQ